MYGYISRPMKTRRPDLISAWSTWNWTLWHSTFVCSSPMSSRRVVDSRAASSAGVISSPVFVSVMPSRTTGATRSFRAGSPMARCSSFSAAGTEGAESAIASRANVSSRTGRVSMGKSYQTGLRLGAVASDLRPAGRDRPEPLA